MPFEKDQCNCRVKDGLKRVEMEKDWKINVTLRQ